MLASPRCALQTGIKLSCADHKTVANAETEIKIPEHSSNFHFKNAHLPCTVHMMSTPD